VGEMIAGFREDMQALRRDLARLASPSQRSDPP